MNLGLKTGCRNMYTDTALVGGGIQPQCVILVKQCLGFGIRFYSASWLLGLWKSTWNVMCYSVIMYYNHMNMLYVCAKTHGLVIPPNPLACNSFSSPKGVWKPRKIDNPDYFEDLLPFRMAPFNALGLELWSMTSDIYFDNFIITSHKEVADRWASDSWGLKKLVASANEVSGLFC